MCLQMAPVHLVNGATFSTIVTFLTGAVATGFGVFVYRIRDRIKNIFKKK